MPDVIPGYHDDKAAVLARLKRVEGQIRGPATDGRRRHVLHRRADAGLRRATKALQSVAVQLLDDHLRHCVTNAVSVR